MDSFSQLRLKYRNQLKPLLEMLKFRKLVMRKEEWLSFVHNTEQNIILSPDQYLSEFEKNEKTIETIHQVFQEFIAELIPSGA